jgi:copper transporter 1
MLTDFQMNMLWNHQVADTCVVFRSWHISGNMGMFISWWV